MSLLFSFCLQFFESFCLWNGWGAIQFTWNMICILFEPVAPDFHFVAIFFLIFLCEFFLIINVLAHAFHIIFRIKYFGKHIYWHFSWHTSSNIKRCEWTNNSSKMPPKINHIYTAIWINSNFVKPFKSSFFGNFLDLFQLQLNFRAQKLLLILILLIFIFFFCFFCLCVTFLSFRMGTL